MISQDGSLVYIENYKAVKIYLDNAPGLAKFRTKYGNGTYVANGLFVKKINSIYVVNFLIPENKSISKRTYLLATKDGLSKFKIDFREILDEKQIIPYFLKFSNTIDDNLFVNLEVKKYLNTILQEAETLVEEM